MLKIVILWIVAIVIFISGYWIGKRITEMKYETQEYDENNDDKKGGVKK